MMTKLKRNFTVTKFYRIKAILGVLIRISFLGIIYFELSGIPESSETDIIFWISTIYMGYSMYHHITGCDMIRQCHELLRRLYINTDDLADHTLIGEVLDELKDDEIQN